MHVREMTWLLACSTFLARTVTAAVEIDPDPLCRSSVSLVRLEAERAQTQRLRILSNQSPLADPGAGPRAMLYVSRDRISGRPQLRAEAEPGANLKVMAAPSVTGPWVILRGFRQSTSTVAWLDESEGAVGHRFYALGQATADEIEPLASNFRLLDLSGNSRELFYPTNRKGVAIVASGPDFAGLKPLLEDLNLLRTEASSRNMELWIVISDSVTPRQELRAQAKQLGLEGVVLVDRDLLARNLLGVTKVGESVLVRTPDFVSVYRGAVREGGRFYLRDAILALKAGIPVEIWEAKGSGMDLTAVGGTQLKYSSEIGPILRTYCVRCHRPGTSAPFALRSFADVQDRASAIRHQVVAGNMPPWQADPEVGSFKDSLALPSEATRKLIAWLDTGALRGEGSDPLLEELPGNSPPVDLTEQLGPPDAVLTLPVQSIRSTGAEPYRTLDVRSPNTSNVWLRAVALIPSNPAVVHHYAVYQPLPSELVGEINLGFGFYVPGRSALPFPDNTGMYLGRLSQILFELHYTPNGKDAVDEPRLHLWYHRERPLKKFTTFTVVNSEFQIPRRDPEYAVAAEHRFEQAVTLHSLAPHMHLRGRSMTFEATYPDGSREMLLSVPHYHFHWQLRYQLATPKTLPAGTTIEVRGTFDNSAQNLANPDPEATISWGQQSWDEMFMGVLEISE